MSSQLYKEKYMKVCPYCEESSSGLLVAEDDWIDYCKTCEIVIEGQTIEVQEEV
jgi:hypothetical protein